MDAGNWVEAEREEKWHPALRGSLNLPERFADAHPSGIPHEALRTVVRRYFASFQEEALIGRAPSFFGRAETFKTYSAAVIARWVHGYGHLQVEWVESTEFGHLERNRFHADTTARLQRLETVAFCVLDDITNVVPRTPAETMLTGIACARFANNRPTVFTGNFPLENDRVQQFADRYSPALARRILRGSAGYLCVTG
jgi:hypothetical protein